MSRPVRPTHNRCLSTSLQENTYMIYDQYLIFKHKRIHHADANVRPSAYCHILLHSKLVRVRFLSRPVHTYKSSGWIEPLAMLCRYKELSSHVPRGKAIMLGLEPTHIMLRSERSTHQPALTRVVMYVPNINIASSRKAIEWHASGDNASIHPSILTHNQTTNSSPWNTSFHMPTLSKVRNKINPYPGWV